MKDLLFFMIAGAMVLLALGAVNARNILHAALYLVWTLSGTALLYLMMMAEFPAIAQVLVYIGGIVVVVVFTILLTSRLGESFLPEHPVRRLAAGAVALTFFLTFAYLLWQHRGLLADRPPHAYSYASLDHMGEAFLAADGAGWLLPFELLSVLLLCAAIGAVVLARRHREIDQEEDP